MYSQLGTARQVELTAITGSPDLEISSQSDLLRDGPDAQMMNVFIRGDQI
ncbi:hypothetical protein [Escherichia coli]|nr:hypothetical protein [Escherichia coli]WIF92438.1 hypothetical protein QN223_05740 [Escherichia coli]WIF92486.1 hypothetical protein QN223_06020 [Escherichia coli]